MTNHTIPLAWKSDFEEKTAAIEVYPAVALASYGLPSSRYKENEDAEVRSKIISGFPSYFNSGGLDHKLLENADVLDATICILAGVDFIKGNVMFPQDMKLAKKEGWIWVKEHHITNRSYGYAS
jgi:hypothetical protein